MAYGLSINFYIKAQKDLGTAKTSAYYSVAPFLGVAFGVLLLREQPGLRFYIGLAIMIAATVLMVKDTISLQHTHEHTHDENEAIHSHTHNSIESHQHAKGLDLCKLVGIHHTAVIVGVENSAIGEDFLLEFIKILVMLHADKCIGAFQFYFFEKSFRSGRTGAGVAEFSYDFILFHAVTSLCVILLKTHLFIQYAHSLL